MPTRLEVLLQRRKSAAAELFHKHTTASASVKRAARRAGNRLGQWELVGIIQESYIKSLTISRGRTGTVNRQAASLMQRVAEIPPVSDCLPCDMAKSVTTPT
jgi:hypothetical protein